MRFVKRSARAAPRVSLVLLDWSVRESFHVLHYLARQTVPRDAFEVNIIEYYDRVSPALEPFAAEVDNWILLDMPKACYYHKHLMYNVGIVASRGDIIMIGDSDAMVKPDFIETIVRAFERDPEIVYHIDQFRNLRRDFYPFNYPSFEEVVGRGCINVKNGKTTGVLDETDPLHTRNYGACMCARRDDMIAIGGADMHIDYLGHICGPYDMTFRLVNHGRREIWDAEHFTYHTWHPGQAGADNYLGPHDGRHMSTTALEAIASRRIMPLAENPAIAALRTGAERDRERLLALAIEPAYRENWRLEKVEAESKVQRWRDYAVPLGVVAGYRLASELGRVVAYPAIATEAAAAAKPAYDGESQAAVAAAIRRDLPLGLRALGPALALAALPLAAARRGLALARLLPLPLPTAAKALIALAASPFLLALAILLVPAPLVGEMRKTVAAARRWGAAVANVPASIRNLQRWRKAEGARTALLTNSRAGLAAARLAARLGLIAPVGASRVVGAAALDAALGALEKSRDAGLVVIAADLAQAHHARVARSPLGRVIAVV